jgi:hypothetical protein
MTTKTITAAPAVTLTNGLRVANFSSPHQFNFVDGTVLPACDNERCAALSMDRADEEAEWTGPLFNVSTPIMAVKPVFEMNEALLAELEAAQESWDVDVVIVPFPLLQALRDSEGSYGESRHGYLSRFTKIGTVIMVDRVTKVAAIDRFGR